MQSIKELYRIGYGPSSSHTMGPRKACEHFKNKNQHAAKFVVTLYGSLAATGKGHLTEKAIEETLHPAPFEIIWKPSEFLPFHPNGMKFEAMDGKNQLLDQWTVFSIGGGEIADEKGMESAPSVYPHFTIHQIIDYCRKEGITFWEYVEKMEGVEIWDYLTEVWDVMKDAITRGIENEGVLPGILHLSRKASSYYIKANGFHESLKRRALIYAFALAVAEENAGGGKIVTAPTCGSCGVLPSVLYLLHTNNSFTDIKILRALATAGLIGNMVKKNASISGAQAGCQAEIGAACAMAAGASAQLFGGTLAQIEYAAEMGIEHFLGLTCDPVGGLVQIPCIERNAFGAARALDCCTYAIMSDGNHRISFDKAVETMGRTGYDLPSLYKETSEGGLAALKGIIKK